MAPNQINLNISNLKKMSEIKLLFAIIGIFFSISIYSQIAPIAPQIETESGDFYGSDSQYGVVLKSPNGSCYRIRIADDGTIFSEAVSCSSSAIFPGAVTHNDGSPASECDCSEHTARLIGVLWADGNWNESNVPPNGSSRPWFVRFGDDSDGGNAIADHYEMILQAHCTAYNRNVNAQPDPDNPGQFLSDAFTLSLQDTQNTNTQIDNTIWDLSGVDLYNHPFITCDPQAFMSAVIESEGKATTGQVYDDPSASKRQAIIDFLNQMEITVLNGPAGTVLLDQTIHPNATWPGIFQDWPFFKWGRVPGGGPAGNPIQTSEAFCSAL